MPRTRSLAWSELKIGLLTIVALVLAAVMIFALSGSGGFSWQRYSLKTVFANIAGLNEGAQVRIAGVPVGAVTGIAFIGDKVEVTFEIAKSMQPRVTNAVAGAARIGLAARRVGRGHHAGQQRYADSGVGLRAGRGGPADNRRHHVVGAGRDSGDHGAAAGHPERARHHRTAGGERYALPRSGYAAAVGQRRDPRHQRRPRARSAGW